MKHIKNKYVGQVNKLAHCWNMLLRIPFWM